MTKPYDIPKALVWEAYLSVKANRGSAGIDQESIGQFEENLSNNLYTLWNRLCSGSYFPPPVKGVPIPKKSGGVRMLGVPTVADRVAQTVVKHLLEPVIDPLFHANSYGYRPGRSAHDAIAMVRRRSWEYDWVIDVNQRSVCHGIRTFVPRMIAQGHGQIVNTASGAGTACRLAGASPSSIRWWTFSSTTMASSTTRPMARTMASSVSRLIE